MTNDSYERNVARAILADAMLNPQHQSTDSGDNYDIVLKTLLNLLNKVNEKKSIKRRKLIALIDNNQR
ncbi:MAG: hypothetical protein SNJ77_06175 [Cytophagales bacterium]